jgi:hypothetical protein
VLRIRRVVGPGYLPKGRDMNLTKNRKLALSITLNVLLAGALLTLFYLVYPQFMYRLESVENFGSYSVRSYRNWENGSAYFEVLRGSEEWDRQPQVPRRIYSCSGTQAFLVETFADITGNGVPELVIQQWSGSASGRGSRYLVLGLDGSTVKEMAVIKGLLSVKCEDPDRDGIKEIIGYDEAYAGFYGFGATNSPLPFVVLSFDETQARFVLNRKLMAKPPLSEEELSRLSAEYKNDPRWSGWSVPPGRLFDTMFDLIYSGNEKQAWELFDTSWPDGCRFSKEQWKGDVQDALRHSPFNPATGVGVSCASVPMRGPVMHR